ncbi:hypothetical protein VNO77_38919 [Canavalia gladiata]|uniref:Uncharacterized protein n=1 Tax=Canavalia gladiata TaxID=3824 RepID=A0AAN9KBA0_CANGL
MPDQSHCNNIELKGASQDYHSINLIVDLSALVMSSSIVSSSNAITSSMSSPTLVTRSRRCAQLSLHRCDA